MSQASYQPVDPFISGIQEVHNPYDETLDDFLALTPADELVLSVWVFDQLEKEILPYHAKASKVSKAAIKGGVPVAKTPKGATNPWFLYRPGQRPADC